MKIEFVFSIILSLTILIGILNIINNSAKKIYEYSLDPFHEIAGDPVKLIMDQKVLVGTTTQTNRRGEAP